MSLIRIAGLLILAGSVLFLIAAVPLRDIYGVQDIEARIAKINAHRSAYVLSQILFAAGAIGTAVGFVVLSAALGAPPKSGWLPILGGILIILGSFFWLVFIYRRTADPEPYFSEYGNVPWQAWAYLILTSVGLLAFGVGFIQAGYPRWIAYATVVVMGLVAAGAIFVPEWLPPQLTYLLTLVIGIVLLMRS